MTAETVFYIFGGALVVLALVTAFVGLRFENFPPSKPVQVLVTTVFAVLVVVTAAYAWQNGEEEQEHRNAEIAAGELPSPQEGLAEQQEGDVPAAPEPVAGGGEAAADSEPEDAGGAGPAAEAAAVDGAQVFSNEGCGGCHTLADAGTTATTGPVLDASLQGMDTKFIEESIVDPNAVVEEGYPPDVMPQTYGDLPPEELDALVQYLAEATGAKG